MSVLQEIFKGTSTLPLSQSDTVARPLTKVSLDQGDAADCLRCLMQAEANLLFFRSSNWLSEREMDWVSSWSASSFLQARRARPSSRSTKKGGTE